MAMKCRKFKVRRGTEKSRMHNRHVLQKAHFRFVSRGRTIFIQISQVFLNRLTILIRLELN
jgi:hypothetical protein